MTGVRALALVIGFWVVMRAVNRDATGRMLVDHILGNQQSISPYLSAQIATGGPSSPSAINASGQVDPFPGATGTWLDMGLDLTGSQFLAPFTGTVVASEQSSSGWRGGGYLAIANAANPQQVVYMAEGLTPTVVAGQTVQAGAPVAIPRANPYNGVVGNIESGPANPANPLQPLAQATSNPVAAVEQFLNWLKSLGGPSATAGHPGYT
jgi:hypothetical protein